MIAEKIREWLGNMDAKVEPTNDLDHGDYTTNIAIITKQDATGLKEKLERNKLPEIERIEVVNPGFLNFFLTKEYLARNLEEVLAKKDKFGWSEKLSGKKVMVEYTDPNPFKEFHIGHLMSNAIGESVSRLIEASGAEVKRACYQGDVGLHVAKALWAKGDYALGAKSYEADEQVKKEVYEINKKIYDKSDESLNKVYEEGRRLSLEKFETMYAKLGTKFDYYFFESETGEFGKKIVQENMGKIFEESDGAVVFKAEKYDEKLHTRVFINSDGLPTYEAKELGLAKTKFNQFNYDESVIITGNEIRQYFKVLLAAMSLVFPDLAVKTKHLSHGMLRLPSGKMSSRTGDVITAEFLLDLVGERVREKNPEAPLTEIAVAAIKYAILKQAPGRDIIFDLEKSLSFEGDSGPYLQYTYARAKSVLEKSDEELSLDNFENNEVARFLARYPDIVVRATDTFSPQIIVQYLLQLASVFNSFYAQNKIIGSPEEASRLTLTAAVAQVIKNGLWLLGIKVPEKM